jgi:phosphoribosylformylglycinamidine synthase
MTSRLAIASKSWAVVQFPGSNCDHDAYLVLKALHQIDSKIHPVMHWHDDPIEKKQYDVIILPGGFSYGDYLRAGAIAKLSRALQGFEKVIEAGAHVMGICNGFQMLLEMRLLPGFLQVNQGLRFISKNCELEITSEAYPWFTKEDIGKKVKFPIAHRFGNYQVPRVDESEVHTILKYQNNPNGSFQNSAGIYRKLGKGSVFGLMPHPERAFFEETRLTDARFLWHNAVSALKASAS